MNKLQRYSLMALLGLTVFALPALADWNEGDPNTKWVQLPDLTPYGVDVKATVPNILADDWQCNDPRPVTDIHIWGSWKNDQKPMQPMQPKPTFKIGIWADIPAGQGGTSFSRPGDNLKEWDFDPASGYTERLYSTLPAQGEYWYDPIEVLLLPNNDHQVWQYNFHLSQPFEQVLGETYWLSVQRVNPGDSYQFGWKTSTQHWNDDAVWGNTNGPWPPAWNELRYPSNHPEYAGQSMDMSFVIEVPEPGTVAMLVGAGLMGLGLLVRRRRGK